MKSWKEINEALNAPLDLSRVQTRRQGSEVVPYLEGDDVINTLNQIFGYDGWSSMMVSPLQTHQVGIRVNKNGESVPLILYLATFQMEFWGLDEEGKPFSIRKADVGKNTAEASAPQMHEMAASGCVTDALKRACRQLGGQFGITLYDKSSSDFVAIQNRSKAPQYPSKAAPSRPAATPKKAVAPAKQTPPQEPDAELMAKVASNKEKAPEKESAPKPTDLERALSYVIPDLIDAGGSKAAVPGSGKSLKDAITSPTGYALVAWLGGKEKSPAGLEPWAPATEEDKKLAAACKFIYDNFDEAKKLAKK